MWINECFCFYDWEWIQPWIYAFGIDHVKQPAELKKKYWNIVENYVLERYVFMIDQDELKLTSMRM